VGRRQAAKATIVAPVLRIGPTGQSGSIPE